MLVHGIVGVVGDPIELDLSRLLRLYPLNRLRIPLPLHLLIFFMKTIWHFSGYANIIVIDRFRHI